MTAWLPATQVLPGFTKRVLIHVHFPGVLCGERDYFCAIEVAERQPVSPQSATPWWWYAERGRWWNPEQVLDWAALPDPHQAKVQK